MCKLMLVARANADAPAKQTVTFWDLGGQSTLRPLWRSYFPSCHGVVFVVDGTGGEGGGAGAGGGDHRDRWGEAASIFATLLNDPLLSGAPLAIFVNKCDVEGGPHATSSSSSSWTSSSASLGEAQDRLHVLDALLMHQRKGEHEPRRFRLFRGSALSGEGIAEMLTWLLEQVQSSTREVPDSDDAV